MGEDGGSVTFDFCADGVRDDDAFEIGEEIEAAEFVEMDQWAGIADDGWRAVISLFHGDPIPRLPSQSLPSFLWSGIRGTAPKHRQAVRRSQPPTLP